MGDAIYRPAMWIRRRKATGLIDFIIYEPNCTGRKHPAIGPTHPDDEVIFIELDKDPELIKHVLQNYDHDACNAPGYPIWEFKVALIAGNLVLGPEKIPELDTDSAPGLHHPEVQCLDYTFTPPDPEEVTP